MPGAAIFSLGGRRVSKTPNIIIEFQTKMYEQVHTDMDGHSKELQQHCRVCGCSTVKDRVTYTCSAYHEALFEAFGIDVMADDTNVHPSRFCNRCYPAMKRKRLTTTLVPFEWVPHSDHESRVRRNVFCRVCCNDYTFRFVTTSKPVTRQAGPRNLRARDAEVGLVPVAKPQALSKLQFSRQ